MSGPLTGLLLGAGASYEIGMPLVWELTTELKSALIPSKIRPKNSEAQKQGRGFPNELIDELFQVINKPEMHYESVLGYFEAQSRRSSKYQQNYWGIYSWLVDIVYRILYLRHIQNIAYIEQHIRFYEGIKKLVELNNPLWIFSLNHDVIVESLAMQMNIPLSSGFTDEIRLLPRRDKTTDQVIGHLKAETLSEKQLERGILNFFNMGTYGINLLKVHGSLDQFTFRDGKDLLRVLPLDGKISGVIESLRVANEELFYIFPGHSDPAKTTNEIAYKDDNGEMQFLRRSLLAGAFKFDNRGNQVLPQSLLEIFKTNINYLSTLVCIGYGFGDIHINQIIRDWLEFDSERKLEIVRPNIKEIPPIFLHLTPQIVLLNTSTTEYLDSLAGIVRTRTNQIEKRLLAYIRKVGESGRTKLGEFLQNQLKRLSEGFIKKMTTLPVKNGQIDLQSLGVSPEEFVQKHMKEAGLDHVDLIEKFLIDNGA